MKKRMVAVVLGLLIFAQPVYGQSDRKTVLVVHDICTAEQYFYEAEASPSSEQTIVTIDIDGELAKLFYKMAGLERTICPSHGQRLSSQEVVCSDDAGFIMKLKFEAKKLAEKVTLTAALCKLLVLKAINVPPPRPKPEKQRY